MNQTKNVDIPRRSQDWNFGTNRRRRHCNSKRGWKLHARNWQGSTEPKSSWWKRPAGGFSNYILQFLLMLSLLQRTFFSHSKSKLLAASNIINSAIWIDFILIFTGDDQHQECGHKVIRANQIFNTSLYWASSRRQLISQPKGLAISLA